mmetsp:Transcript_27065/g.62579  ORF Transcript_27065/g.62579 Transcript_27065/m.62579 type:complete len:236 (+) Transcript_27065:178-885(+)
MAVLVVCPAPVPNRESLAWGTSPRYHHQVMPTRGSARPVIDGMLLQQTPPVSTGLCLRLLRLGRSGVCHSLGKSGSSRSLERSGGAPLKRPACPYERRQAQQQMPEMKWAGHQVLHLAGLKAHLSMASVSCSTRAMKMKMKLAWVRCQAFRSSRVNRGGRLATMQSQQVRSPTPSRHLMLAQIALNCLVLLPHGDVPHWSAKTFRTKIYGSPSLLDRTMMTTASKKPSLICSVRL